MRFRVLMLQSHRLIEAISAEIKVLAAAAFESCTLDLGYCQQTLERLLVFTDGVHTFRSQ